MLCKFSAKEKLQVKKFLWMLVAAAIMLTPVMMTGCGADDTEADAMASHNTIGPGNLDHFPSGS
jgi:hypothetical protein